MYFSYLFVVAMYRCGVFLVIILALLDILTFFYYPDAALSKIFLATREQTPLTWVSAAALLLVAGACLSAYQQKREKLWYILGAIFLFFSMDDATYFHERLSGFLSDHVSIFSGFPTYIWVVLYAPMLLFAIGALIYALWRDAPKARRRMIVATVLMLGGAIFLDLVDGFMQKNESIVLCIEAQCHHSFVHLMRLTEEMLEVLAIGMLGYLTICTYCLFDKR